MQAVANLIEQLNTQISIPSRSTPFNLGLHLDLPTVITPPSTTRWSESPLCGSGDDLDEDEAYFLDEDDEDDDDEEDEYDDDDDDDFDDDDEELDEDENMDEEDF